MMNISEDNKIHLQRFKNVPPCASYIAGFIDGDGCIFIRKISDGYQSGFTITQCRTNALQVLRMEHVFRILDFKFKRMYLQRDRKGGFKNGKDNSGLF